MNDEERLLHEYRQFKKHKWGEGKVEVRPHGDDEISILIKAGKVWRFILKTDEED